MLGIYIHVPFCSAICNYCNFNRGLFDAALKERYVEALLAEIASARGRESRLEAEGPRSPGMAWGWGPAREKQCRDTADTIYFGGGTPSLLEPEEIARIIDGCHQTFDLSTDAET